MSQNGLSNFRALFTLSLLFSFICILFLVMKWLPFEGLKTRIIRLDKVRNKFKNHLLNVNCTRTTWVTQGALDLLTNIKDCLPNIKISVLGDSTAGHTYHAMRTLLNCKIVKQENMKDGHLPGMEYFSKSGT